MHKQTKKITKLVSAKQYKCAKTDGHVNLSEVLHGIRKRSKIIYIKRKKRKCLFYFLQRYHK